MASNVIDNLKTSSCNVIFWNQKVFKTMVCEWFSFLFCENMPFFFICWMAQVRIQFFKMSIYTVYTLSDYFRYKLHNSPYLSNHSVWYVLDFVSFVFIFLTADIVLGYNWKYLYLDYNNWRSNLRYKHIICRWDTLVIKKL